MSSFTDTVLTLFYAFTIEEIIIVLGVSFGVLALLFLFLVIFLKCHIALYGQNDQGLETLNASMEKWEKTIRLKNNEKP